ncbi:MAG: hypothetical protein MR316_00465 [Lachnospiraceae bacterium]|nr:hypothetical protein [Lachnospiraceae bacterium]
MNKKITKLFALLVLACICITTIGAEASASTYDLFKYKKGIKVYRELSLTKGKKHLVKNTNRKDQATQYQIVKMTGDRLVIRPQKGYYDSADPYFYKKKMTVKLSKNCRFYYTDVLFPNVNEHQTYRRVSRKAVKRYMKELEIYYSHIQEAGKGKYYSGGYFGELYMKNGKVVAVLTNGGD